MRDFGAYASTGTTGTPGYLALRKDVQDVVRAGPEMSTLVRMRMTRGALGFDCFERRLESFCGVEEVGISRYAEREVGRWRGGQRESSNTRRIWDISVTRQLFRVRGCIAFGISASERQRGGISLQLSPNLDVSFKVGGRMGHWVSLGVVDAREIRRVRLVGRWGSIQCALPLVDDGILLCEPGAEVSLFVCVELVLGHLVPPSGPLWHEIGRAHV